ncbi:MAG: zinc ribbon domain-containing protein [Candidatus Omnitrophica bacterium]|nr:zinc ribbon domain-containing protein [Candidatus Omnitrophota bacterium]
MAVYEYVCTECGEKIEIRASISEKEKGLNVVCPKCGSKKVARVFGTFMIGGSSRKENSPAGCAPGCLSCRLKG